MKNVKRILWGVCIAALGVIIGLNSFGVADINIFFDGWWTLFIIVPSIVGLIEGGGRTVSLIFLVAGILLLLECQGFVTWEMISKLILPVVLVIVGISIIFKGVIKDKVTEKIKNIRSQESGSEAKEYNAFFSGQDISFDGQVFEGCKLAALFGGIKCDLSGAVIQKDIVIDAEGIFGGVDIILPQGVNCAVKSSAIFGGVSNKYSKNKEEGRPTVYVNGTAVFGGVDVK